MFRKILSVLFLLLFACVSIYPMMGLLIKGSNSAELVMPMPIAQNQVNYWNQGFQDVTPLVQMPIVLHQELNAANPGLVSMQSNPMDHCVAINVQSNQSVVPFQQELSSYVVAARLANNEMQAERYVANIIAREIAEGKKQKMVEAVKLELPSKISTLKFINYLPMKDYTTLTGYELDCARKDLKSNLPQLKTNFQNLMSQNCHLEWFVNVDDISDLNLNKLTDQDVVKLNDMVNLKLVIACRERNIAGIDSEFKQRERDFANELKNASIDQIATKIIPALEKKAHNNEQKLNQAEKYFAQINNEMTQTSNHLSSVQKKNFMVKAWRAFTRDGIEKILEEKLQKLDMVREKIRTKDLASLSAEAKEISKKIEYAQTVLNEKIAQEKLDQEAQLERERQEALRLQEKQAQEEQLLQQAHDLQLVTEQENAEFLQKQQEIELGYKEQLKNQYCSLDFDSPGCSDSVLCERQDALSRTEQSDYAAYDQEYVLSPQAQAFLKLHHIDDTQIQNFSGTALQQQLHVEYCNIIEQAASKQAELFYQSDLLKQCVLCADAAYDANQLGQIQMVLSLNNLGFTLLEYGQAIDTGVALAGKGFLHTLAHPQESIKSIGRAVYFVLETAALNCYSEEYGFEDLYIPLRDQRNAAIAAGLKTLGKKIANSTGPQRVQAFMQCAVEFAIPGTIASVAGGVMGIAESAVVKAANAVQAETNIAKTVQAVATIVGKSQGAQEAITDVAKAAHQAEIAVQEQIAQNVAKELLNAEKQLDKSKKIVSGYSAEIIKQSKATPPRTLADKQASALKKAERLAEKTRELPDGRTRYYEKERLSDTLGPTRGRSFVTEFDPRTGRVRQWNECYDHAGNVNRVRPTMINGKTLESQHYPITYKDLQNNIKGSKWRIQEKILDKN